MADMLSRQRTGMWWRNKRSSMNNVQSQATSTGVEANSAVVEEWETIDCFLEDHKTGLEPRKTNNPIVDCCIYRYI